MLGGGGTQISGQTQQTTSSKSGDASGSSYVAIDNSMVIGGGGSLTKGSMGTPAGEAVANMAGTQYFLPAMIAMGVVVAFLAFRK